MELDIQNIEDPNRDLFEEYLDQRATKEELKRQLTELTAKVFEETGHPTVFIIDELDRCRPTFAIELLERVKHIFDVPNLVFVIGINHDELCKSLKSVYGEISADIYLRRFFDIEFTLPEADSESFCRHLFEKFELREFFASLRNGARSDVHINEFDYLSGNFPYLWGKLGLSLRDIENCVRLVALVGKNIDPQRTMYPELIGLLIPLKFANPNLYRGFVRGDSIGSEVMNYIDEKLNGGDPDGNPSNLLNVVEVFLYFSDNRFDTRGLGESQSIRQLEMLSKNQKPTPPYFLSKRTQESDPTRIMRLTHIAGNPQQRHLPPGTIGYLADLIDLHQEMLRR